MLTPEDKQALQDELWKALEIGPATADEALCRLPQSRQAQLRKLWIDGRALPAETVARALDALCKVTTVYASGKGKARTWSTTPPPVLTRREDALTTATMKILALGHDCDEYALWAQLPVEVKGDPRMEREARAALLEVLGDLVKEGRVSVTGRGKGRLWKINESHVESAAVEEVTAPTVEPPPEAGPAPASKAPAKKPRARKVKAAEPGLAPSPAPVEPAQQPAQLEVRYLQILTTSEPIKIERIWSLLSDELRALLGDAASLTPPPALLAHLVRLEKIGMLREIPKGWLLVEGGDQAAVWSGCGQPLAAKGLTPDWSDLAQIAERARAEAAPWKLRWALEFIGGATTEGGRAARNPEDIGFEVWRLRWALALLAHYGRVEVCQGWDEGHWRGSQHKPAELLAWRWAAPQEPQPTIQPEPAPIVEAACDKAAEVLDPAPTPAPLSADQIIAEQEARRRALRRARRATERGRRRTDAEMAQEELHLFKLLLRGPLVRPGAQIEAVLAELVEARFATLEDGVWRAVEGVKLETFRSWSRGKPLMEVVE